LSIVLMICSLVVIPMFVVAVVHVVFLVLKARGEEGALLARHGQVYADYFGPTRRFVPWKRPTVTPPPEGCGTSP
jgi:protein-S-isoprenylcysteine O-methyltransferase Ste14